MEFLFFLPPTEMCLKVHICEDIDESNRDTDNFDMKCDYVKTKL